VTDQTRHQTNPMAEAWIRAAEDLGVRVWHPYTFTTTNGVAATTQGVYLPDFGSPAGTLLVCRFDLDAVCAMAEDTAYFRSAINPLVYEPYRRALYVDTLNDWGWFSDPSNRPPWYVAPRWIADAARQP
jgi:hypothetical protein